MGIFLLQHWPRLTPVPQTAASTITLRELFQREIDKHRIPVERGVIASLAMHPAFSPSAEIMVLSRWHQR